MKLLMISLLMLIVLSVGVIAPDWVPIEPICWEGDDDNDGVCDDNDMCYNTPEGAEVGRLGCTPEQFCSQMIIYDRHQARSCRKLMDWQDNEGRNPRDCRVKKIDGIRTCVPRRRID